MLKLKENAIIDIPPKTIDTSKLSFDNAHVNIERTRNISREQSESWIKNALFSIEVWNGEYINYISEEGASYVEINTMKIRTAFSKEKYTENFIKSVKVMKNGN